MLGVKLKELRIKMNMSQQQLADLSGIDRTTIGKYELKNVRPSYEILEKICKALNTTPEYLTKFDNDCTRRKKIPTELINFIKKADYTIYGSPVLPKDKKRISRMVALYYYDVIKDREEKSV